MKEDVAHIVFPVLKEGLQLKEKLDRGERLDFQQEQARLTLMLKRETEARRWPSYGGDGDEFLGLRYALACWLDELYCALPTDWGRRWNNSKRETALYSSNDRNWKFWDQAKLAESRSDKDALEGFYLCVMLGFRGNLADQPDQLMDWREAVERQISQGETRAWPGPAELPPPPPNVPPLQAREKFRKVITAVVVVVGVSILALAYQVVKNLGG